MPPYGYDPYSDPYSGALATPQDNTPPEPNLDPLQHAAMLHMLQQTGVIGNGQPQAPQIDTTGGMSGDVASLAHQQVVDTRQRLNTALDRTENYAPPPLETFNQPYPTRQPMVPIPTYDTAGFGNTSRNLMGLAGLASIFGGDFTGRYGGQAANAGVEGAKDYYDKAFQHNTEARNLAQDQQDKVYGDETQAWHGGAQMVNQRNVDNAREAASVQRASYGPANILQRQLKGDEATAKAADAQQITTLQKQNTASLNLITSGRLAPQDVQKQWQAIQDRNALLHKMQGLPTDQPADISNFFDKSTEQQGAITGKLQIASQVATDRALAQKQKEVFDAGQNAEQRRIKQDEFTRMLNMHMTIANNANRTHLAAVGMQTAAQRFSTNQTHAYLMAKLGQDATSQQLRSTIKDRDVAFGAWNTDYTNMLKTDTQLQAAHSELMRISTAPLGKDETDESRKKAIAVATAHMLRAESQANKTHDDFDKNEVNYQRRIAVAEQAEGTAYAKLQEPPKNAAKPTQAINPGRGTGTPIGGSGSNGRRLAPAPVNKPTAPKPKATGTTGRDVFGNPFTTD